MRLIAAVFLVLALQPATPPPNTDVFLASLSNVAGALTVGQPANVTNSPGYDNQPSFTPDSRAILYTSTREDGQSDIYRVLERQTALTTARSNELKAQTELNKAIKISPSAKIFKKGAFFHTVIPGFVSRAEALGRLPQVKQGVRSDAYEILLSSWCTNYLDSGDFIQCN